MDAAARDATGGGSVSVGQRWGSRADDPALHWVHHKMVWVPRRQISTGPAAVQLTRRAVFQRPSPAEARIE
jgi:hypothetical protein